MRLCQEESDEDEAAKPPPSKKPKAAAKKAKEATSDEDSEEVSTEPHTVLRKENIYICSCNDSNNILRDSHQQHQH